MLRKIIEINEELCNGCGKCAAACHEGAIGMVNGKARLLRDDYCDGLGDCLPVCPTGAIKFVMREAEAYDEAAAQRNKQKAAGGCPGMIARALGANSQSELKQWPVQIKLAPVNAPYFKNASLLIAADCTAYAYANFHRDFIAGRTVLIGCTKLNFTDYSEKLAEIFKQNDIKDITVVRMQVPCCGGMEYAVKTALEKCGKDIPLKVTVLSLQGEILQ